MNAVSWDEVLFVVLTHGFEMSPALLGLIWVLRTKIPQVRRRLLIAIAIAAITPFLGGLGMAVLQSQCEIAGLDALPQNCGVFPDSIDIIFVVGELLPVLLFGAYAILRSLYDELRKTP